MIAVVPGNPSVDRRLTVPALVRGENHRPLRVRVPPGGKGFNVVRSVAALGGRPAILGAMQDAGSATRFPARA